MRPVVAACLSSFVLSVAVRAQCSDPAPPRDGFTIRWEYDKTIPLSDGYKTRADVVVPTVAAGRCGWPLLVSVHGGPSSFGKLGLRGENQELAKRGFLAVGYDVRGQGRSHVLNPGRGTTLMGLDEWIDMFEVIEWALNTYGAAVDPNRIGVYGTSQGGWHAWAAAAYSGKVPPTNRRRSARFPTIQAAVTRYINPSFHDSEIPNGTVFKSVLASIAFYRNNGGWILDANVQRAFQTFMNNDDPKGLRAWFRADPGRDFLNELRTTSVPVLAILSWHDYHAAPNRALDIFDAMPATTPRRIVLDTGGHGSPTNMYQRDRVPILTRHWLQRFAKRAGEPIEQGPPVLLASIPAAASEYQSFNSLWRHRADRALPAADVRTRSYYLRANGRLSTDAPRGQEPADTVAHRVAAGYTMARYVQDGAGSNPSRIASSIPLRRVSFVTDALRAGSEISGVPEVRVSLKSSHADFLIAAQLFARPPTGPRQLVASGARGVRGKAGTQQVVIEMDVLNTVVNAGWRVELELQNYLVVRLGGGQVVRYIPLFHNYDLTVEHSASALSELRLPLRPAVRPDLSTQTLALRASPQLSPVQLQVRSSPERSGNPYVLLCSMSGQKALALPGSTLWLSWDVVTTTFLGAINTPMLDRFAGVLDANGRATATLDLGKAGVDLTPIAWSNLHIAPVVIGGGRMSAGAPLQIELR